MRFKIIDYIFTLCFIIGLFYGLEKQGTFLQYTICVLVLLIFVQQLLKDFFWERGNS